MLPQNLEHLLELAARPQLTGALLFLDLVRFLNDRGLRHDDLLRLLFFFVALLISEVRAPVGPEQPCHLRVVLHLATPKIL